MTTPINTPRHEDPSEDQAVCVWLDDDLVDRAAPEGWLHVQTAQAAIDLLRTRVVLELSLDHDLGDDEVAGTGYQVCLFLAEQSENGTDLWPRETLAIHSANFSASPRMAGVIDRYSPLQRILGRRRWQRAVIT
ncbi:MAG TPA: cyclic-phosphate processing receiver domain-containing protein [Solirubrobacteraceae bacterium]|jgi:hypothetical protein